MGALVSGRRGVDSDRLGRYPPVDGSPLGVSWRRAQRSCPARSGAWLSHAPAADAARWRCLASASAARCARPIASSASTATTVHNSAPRSAPVERTIRQRAEDRRQRLEPQRSPRPGLVEVANALRGWTIVHRRRYPSAARRRGSDPSSPVDLDFHKYTHRAAHAQNDRPRPLLPWLVVGRRVVRLDHKAADAQPVELDVVPAARARPGLPHRRSRIPSSRRPATPTPGITLRELLSWPRGGGRRRSPRRHHLDRLCDTSLRRLVRPMVRAADDVHDAEVSRLVPNPFQARRSHFMLSHR